MGKTRVLIHVIGSGENDFLANGMNAFKQGFKIRVFGA
jgi:hypothetical protein